MKKILIIGATSAIANACARSWASEHAKFFLVARNPERLCQIADDLKARGARSAETAALDLNEFQLHGEVIESCFNSFGILDICLIAHGSLPDQKRCEADVGYALREIFTNGISVVALLTLIADRMEKQGSGTIAVVSSVAGERGRQSNYVYGSAKATVTTFTSGLRQRLARKGVHVVTIKPGFVDTPMTRHLDKGPLWATPEAVGTGIIKAINLRKSVVYLPGFWSLIMLVIRSIPENLFMRLKL